MFSVIKILSCVLWFNKKESKRKSKRISKARKLCLMESELLVRADSEKNITSIRSLISVKMSLK